MLAASPIMPPISADDLYAAENDPLVWNGIEAVSVPMNSLLRLLAADPSRLQEIVAVQKGSLRPRRRAELPWAPWAVESSGKRRERS